MKDPELQGVEPSNQDVIGLTVDEIIQAGHTALRKLLVAGRDRVVHRDGEVQILKPQDAGYWEQTGFDDTAPNP
jgi:hypothetical protein